MRYLWALRGFGCLNICEENLRLNASWELIKEEKTDS